MQRGPQRGTNVNNNIAVPNERAVAARPYIRPPQPRSARAAHLFGGQHPRLSDARPDRPPLALAGPRRGRARACRRRSSSTLLTTPVYRACGDARGQSADRRGQRRAIARARSDRSTIPMTSSRPRSACCRARASPSAPRRSSTSPIIRTSSPQDRRCVARGSRSATGKVQGGLKVDRARRGQADQVQLRFDIAAAGRAGRQRHRRQLHQHGAPAPLRSVGLRPQLPRAADRQDPRRPRAVGARAGRLCPAAGHHQHRRDEPTASRPTATPIRFRANR